MFIDEKELKDQMVAYLNEIKTIMAKEELGEVTAAVLDFYKYVIDHVKE